MYFYSNCTSINLFLYPSAFSLWNCSFPVFFYALHIQSPQICLVHFIIPIPSTCTRKSRRAKETWNLELQSYSNLSTQMQLQSSVGLVLLLHAKARSKLLAFRVKLYSFLNEKLTVKKVRFQFTTNLQVWLLLLRMKSK